MTEMSFENDSCGFINRQVHRLKSISACFGNKHMHKLVFLQLMKYDVMSAHKSDQIPLMQEKWNKAAIPFISTPHMKQ